MAGRRRPRLLVPVVLLACAVVPVCACGQKAETSARPAPSGTERMVERLRQLAEQADPRANVYLNDRRVGLFRQELAQRAHPGEQVPARLRLAIELLYAGQTPEAIAHIEAVKAVVDRVPQAVSTEHRRWLRDLLAISYLRLGEQENCLAMHNVDSCLMPIRRQGVHRARRGSEAAYRLYAEALEEDPEDLSARWLLNVAAMTLGRYPDDVPEAWRIPPAAFASDAECPRFFDVAAAAGVAAVGLAGGSVMEDLDGDGLLDLMASSWGMTDQLRVFRNNGDGTFTDRTTAAGLTGIVGGLNLVHADYDNDGDADVLVLRGAWWAEEGRHPNSLLRNNGNGTFDDVTEAAGLLSFHPTQTAAWADYDNDGWLDLFIGNESGDGTQFFTSDEGGMRGRGGGAAGVHPCELYHNNRDGTFTEAAKPAGVANVGFVKGVAWGDYNNDGRPDLFLSRMGQPNVLYRNDGPQGAGWRFTEVTAEAGVEDPIRSFPTWFWDYDNDGWLDLYVGAFSARTVGDIAAMYLGRPIPFETDRLYRNNGDGTFTDVTQALGCGTAQFAMGANFGDLDNDGWLDFYVGNGSPNPRTLLPNRMYRNEAGRRFADVTTAGGFGHVQKGHGIAFGDLDNDGDQDLYAVMGGAYSGDVYANALFANPSEGTAWITLRLTGATSNRSAIGARIAVHVPTPRGARVIRRVAGTGGSFGSSSLQEEIGLGDALGVQAIEVTWPATGALQRFETVGMNACWRIREGEPMVERVPLPTFTLPAGGSVPHAHEAPASSSAPTS